LRKKVCFSRKHSRKLTPDQQKENGKKKKKKVRVSVAEEGLLLQKALQEVGAWPAKGSGKKKKKVLEKAVCRYFFFPSK